MNDPFLETFEVGGGSDKPGLFPVEGVTTHGRWVGQGGL